MLCGQFFDLIVLFVLQLFDEVLPVVFHLVSHLLHLEVVFLLQVVGPSLELLPQLCLPFVVLCLKGEGIVLLRKLLLLQRDMQRSNVSLQRSFLDAMLILELFHGDLNILPELALLVLVDEQNMFDPAWGRQYFCL